MYRVTIDRAVKDDKWGKPDYVQIYSQVIPKELNVPAIIMAVINSSDNMGKFPDVPYTSIPETE
jgi:hypothetical protein